MAILAAAIELVFLMTMEEAKEERDAVALDLSNALA